MVNKSPRRDFIEQNQDHQPEHDFEPDFPKNNSPVAEFDLLVSMYVDASMGTLLNCTQKVTSFRGYRPLDSTDVQSKTHVHQFGHFGVSSIGEMSIDDAAGWLIDALTLAEQLEALMQHPTKSATCLNVNPAPPEHRQPMIWVSYTNGLEDTIDDNVWENIIHHLKFSSPFCSDLLRLNEVDKSLWNQTWHHMAPQDRTAAETIGNTFFGRLTDIYPTMQFLHVYVMMVSADGPRNTVFLRVSVGRDTQKPPLCSICERNVMAIDAFTHTGAIQFTIPLLQQPSPICKASDLLISKDVETLHWSQLAYGMKGWSTAISCKRTLHDTSFEDLESIIQPDFWDPLAISEPTASFQPYGSSKMNLAHARKKCCVHWPDSDCEEDDDDRKLRDYSWNPYAEEKIEVFSDAEASAGFLEEEECDDTDDEAGNRY